MMENLVSASKRWKPLRELLDDLINRVATAIPGSLCVALSIRNSDRPLTVLATHGIADDLARAQLDRFGGPVFEFRRWRWFFWLAMLAFLAGVIRVPIAVLQLTKVMSADLPSWFLLLQGALA